VTDSDSSSILLAYGINYDRKKFYNIGSCISFALTRVGSSLACNHNTRLAKIAWHKLSSLLQAFLNYCRKKVLHSHYSDRLLSCF